MTLYAGHMTGPDQAAYELRQALLGIMRLEDPLDSVEHVKSDDGSAVIEVRLYPAEAIELADWIRSKTEASVDSPFQGQFSFTTE